MNDRAERLVGMADDLKEFVYAEEFDNAETLACKIEFELDDIKNEKAHMQRLIQKRGIE